MDVNRPSTEVIKYQVLLDFANTADGAFENLLDEDALLRMHDLVVAFLKLAIDLDVLDVEYSVVRKPLLEAPQFAVLHADEIKR